MYCQRIMHGCSPLDDRPLYPYDTGKEHCWIFAPTRHTLLAPGAKRDEVFDESRKG